MPVTLETSASVRDAALPRVPGQRFSGGGPRPFSDAVHPVDPGQPATHHKIPGRTRPCAATPTSDPAHQPGTLCHQQPGPRPPRGPQPAVTHSDPRCQAPATVKPATPTICEYLQPVDAASSIAPNLTGFHNEIIPDRLENAAPAHSQVSSDHEACLSAAGTWLGPMSVGPPLPAFEVPDPQLRSKFPTFQPIDPYRPIF
ncbi:hypothetical protein Francci3_1103 [Frankia casuarinae]|uniref:Uncharacterized protein n=1 Tax=Frankia casuarinae (strain DSM 45818 / CECT 9043 / HFP020203 / CcI3) TaxID=106370 RepID=Q2JE09_FRACC|nr:hypothetical protein Francci3_1103 [Frankia casuarinae]